MENQEKKNNKRFFIKLLLGLLLIILLVFASYYFDKMAKWVDIKIKGYNCIYKYQGFLVDDIKCYYPNGTFEVYK